MIRFKTNLALKVTDLGLLPADLPLKFFLHFIILALNLISLLLNNPKLTIHLLQLSLSVFKLRHKLGVLFSHLITFLLQAGELLVKLLVVV